MKKKLLWTGLCLLAVGIGMSWAGRAMGGSVEAKTNLFGQSIYMYCAPSYVISGGPLFSASYSGDQKNEIINNQNLAAFQSLDIKVDLGDVTVVEGDSYGVELSWWGVNYQLNYSNENGKLKVWSSSKSGISLSTSNVGSEVTVTVPAGTVLDSLDLNVDLGDAYLDGLRARQADLTLSLGNLTGYEMEVSERTTVKADLGDVSLSGDFRGKIDVEADLGSVELNFAGPGSDYNYDLNLSLGSAQIDGAECSGNHVTGGRGSNTIKVNADLGDIQLNFDI